MRKDTKFHLYDVTTTGEERDLAARLRRVDRISLRERLRAVEKKGYRAEKISFGDFMDAEVAYLNFVYAREDGPGKLSASNETTGVGLEDDETFSEEAAIMIDFTNHIIVGEYNHHGAKVSTFMTYLSDSVFDVAGRHCIASAEPRLHNDVEYRLRNKRNVQIKRFEMKLKPDLISEDEYYENGVHIEDSMDMLYQTGRDTEGETISIIISGGRGGGLIWKL